MEHCMVDTETVGIHPGFAILSIGAVMFDLEKQELGEEFYMAIEPESNRRFGLKFDPNTETWWSEQTEDARAAAWSGTEYLDEVLSKFSVWSREQAKLDQFYFWSNGANFDDPMLTAAYTATGLTKPWKFQNSRCFRTLKALSPTVFVKSEGVQHNALVDARWQAKGALLMYAGLKEKYAALAVKATKGQRELAKKFDLTSRK